MGEVPARYVSVNTLVDATGGQMLRSPLRKGSPLLCLPIHPSFGFLLVLNRCSYVLRTVRGIESSQVLSTDTLSSINRIWQIYSG
jgi:hypothetical protein